MFVRSEAQDHVTDEYGGRFRRLYPWEGVASPLVAMSANDYRCTRLILSLKNGSRCPNP